MCLAVPGKILSIDGDEATIDYHVETRTAKIIDQEFSVGDYVIVQGGIVVMTIPADQAEQALKTYVDALETK